MKKRVLVSALLLLCAACSDSNLEISEAAKNSTIKPQPLLEIYAPNSGDVLPAHTPFTLEYAVVRGEGTAVQVQVGKQKPVTIAHTRGQHLIEGLPPGRYRIVVKELDQYGRPTGGRTGVDIRVQ
jgi:hypothetical protein